MVRNGLLIIIIIIIIIVFCIVNYIEDYSYFNEIHS